MTGVLIEELVEEVLLRFRPEDPASLVRAALVSKTWCRLIAGRQLRELHRAAPMLGFICNVHWDEEICDADALLVPTSSCLPRAHHHGWRALDCRHGRVLLCNVNCFGSYGTEPLDPFVVWNPVTGEHLRLPYLPLERCATAPMFFNATVLCAGGDACNHLNGDCHRGRFLVVFAGNYADGLLTYVYSSESGAWSESSIAVHPADYLNMVPAALVGNALYFKLNMSIVKYDLGTRENCIIHMPPAFYERGILMTTEQGKLGFTRVDEFMLYQWSMGIGAEGDVEWTQDRVIKLKNLLPADALLIRPHVVGCVHGRGVVFIGTGNGFFTVDAKLYQATKIGEGIPCKTGHHFFGVVPYTSFYFPALGAVPIAEEPNAGVSSA